MALEARVLTALDAAEKLIDTVDTDECNYNGLGELADASHRALELIRSSLAAPSSTEGGEG